jgi:hypothetical protein
VSDGESCAAACEGGEAIASSSWAKTRWHAETPAISQAFTFIRREVA